MGQEGRPKRRWLDSARADLRENELSGEKVYKHGTDAGDCHHTSMQNKGLQDKDGEEDYYVKCLQRIC